MLRPLSDYEKTYQIEKIIGRGQYGIIFLVQHKETGQQFAAKKVDGNYSDIELNILFQLKHPNIITVYECFKDDNTTIFIMEYCKKGDLWNLIQYRLLEGKEYGFNQRVVEQWLIQLLMGLAHIHDNNILHRDLKSMNILIKDDGQLKITDFGVAKVLKQNNFANTITGSPYYLSPEISQGLEYSYASDIWSLGCIIFELCTLKHAFEGKELDNVLQNIQSGRLSQEILIEDQSNQEKTNSFRKYTPELINLIKSLLNLDPNKRPTAKDLLKTPYVAKIMLQSFSKPKQTKQSTTSLQDMDKIGHVTMMQKKAHEQYDKQMNYVKSLLGSKDSINAQSQVLNTQQQLLVKKQTSI